MIRGSLAVMTVALTLLGLGSRPSRADDKWELGALFDDDSSTTKNVFGHGVTQTHDLQGTMAAPDQDWIDVAEIVGHSYEVQVDSGTVRWNASSTCSPCADLDRVTSAGTVLTGATGAGVSGAAQVRWIHTAGEANSYIRAMGPTNATYTTFEEYDIRFYDTTYFIPRWNNSATQATILVIQPHSGTVTGDINFYDAAGTLLHTEPLNVPNRGTQVFNSATVPALQGGSGSVTIAHLGGWGALSGKAVAVEPTTGFTFDTMMTPLAP